MRKHKKSRSAMEAVIDSMKAGGFGLSKNGKSLAPESKEYRTEAKLFLQSVGPEELEQLLKRWCPNLSERVSK
jgi:hypothetical protein